jgi:hypothetical protein
MAVILFPTIPTIGAPKDWIGLANPPSPNWSELNNWDPNAMPGPTDDLSFGISTSGGTIVDPTWASSQGLIATLTADADGILKLGAAGGLTATRLSTTGDILKDSSLSLNDYMIKLGPDDKLDVGNWLGSGTATTAIIAGVEVEMIGEMIGSSTTLAEGWVTERIGPGRWQIEHGFLDIGFASPAFHEFGPPAVFAGEIDSEVTAPVVVAGESAWTITGSQVFARRGINLDYWSLEPVGSARVQAAFREFLEVNALDLKGQRAHNRLYPPVGLEVIDCTEEHRPNDCLLVNVPEAASGEIAYDDPVKGLRVLGSLTASGEGSSTGLGPLVRVWSLRPITVVPTSDVAPRRALLVKRGDSEDPSAYIELGYGARMDIFGSEEGLTDAHSYPMFADESRLLYGPYEHPDDPGDSPPAMPTEIPLGELFDSGFPNPGPVDEEDAIFYSRNRNIFTVYNKDKTAEPPSLHFDKDSYLAMGTETTSLPNDLLIGLRDTSFDIATELWKAPAITWNSSGIDLVFLGYWGQEEGGGTMEAISVDVCNVLFMDAPAAKRWRSLGVGTVGSARPGVEEWARSGLWHRLLASTTALLSGRTPSSAPRYTMKIVDVYRNQQSAVPEHRGEVLYFSGDIVLDHSAGRVALDLQGRRVYYGGRLVSTGHDSNEFPGGMPIPAIVTKYGDFDGDCDVDLQDFVTFQAGFGGDFDRAPHRPATDYDGDQDADLDDFAAFAAAMAAHGVGHTPTDAACADADTRPALVCPAARP